MKRVYIWTFVLVLLVGAAPAASGDDEVYKTVLKYKVLMKGKKVGWAKAVIKKMPGALWLTISSKVRTKFMGVDVRMSSKTIVKYNAKRRATYFNIHYTNPMTDIHVMGNRSGKGYNITRTKGDKTQELRIEDGTYDRVSVEPALWSDPVGSKKKLRVLFAGQGKVGKATISILSRKKKLLLGRKTFVTHFKIKGKFGSVEEWRMDDGSLEKSQISTPIGKLFIQPVE